MRRTLPLLVCLFVALPSATHAQKEEAPTNDEDAKPKKKSKAEGSDRKFDDVELTPKRKKTPVAEKPDLPKPASPAKREEPPAAQAVAHERPELEKPANELPRYRYAYLVGGGLVVAGLAFAYSAQGEAKRAETIGTAREAAQALETARASAATANVIYGAAAATLVAALLFEILPQSVAQKASLTFHF